jgi:hypothetical protein
MTSEARQAANEEQNEPPERQERRGKTRERQKITEIIV